MVNDIKNENSYEMSYDNQECFHVRFKDRVSIQNIQTKQTYMFKINDKFLVHKLNIKDFDPKLEELEIVNDDDVDAAERRITKFWRKPKSVKQST